MKYLYKYPQNPYPYLDLINTNRRRSRTDPEYELIDTGIFNEDRYFDVFVEYAQAHLRISVSRSVYVIGDPMRARSMCCQQSGSAILGHGGRKNRSHP